MTTVRREIVITGFGALTPLGRNADAVWANLAAGKSGVDVLQAFAVPPDFPPYAAEIRDFDPKNYVANRKSLRVMARDIQLAVGAAKLAIDHSGLAGKVDPVRFGVNCGAGLIATEHDDLGDAVQNSLDARGKFDLKLWGKEGMERMYPLWMLKYLPNMPACHISILHDAQGPNNSITAGEASSLLAIGEAFRIIERGGSDVFLAGGSDTKIHPLSLVRMALLNKLCSHVGNPAEAARPFDADASGLVPSEAAAFVALESAEHAADRSAKVYAKLLGFGASCNRNVRSAAITQAVRLALADANLDIADLGLVVAHGSGLPEEDKTELAALAEFLGPAAVDLPIVAYKGYWGHVASACGVVDLVATLIAWQHRQVPTTLNYRSSRQGAPRLAIVREPIDFPDRPVLIYAMSHSGQCGALVVRPLAA